MDEKDANSKKDADQKKLIEKLLGTSDCEYLGIGRMVINKDFIVGLPTTTNELIPQQK